ncbi:sensor histidine kinase [Aegicerativicinus sediminis]|uniref:sensor histidine kinase n=1 Tax=Aegicerativicinus sediminis TaxID=2893202 RepID=UPI001E4DA9D4|nr:sensor histidine kinase [Aegicerativicinus sediminis]
MVQATERPVSTEAERELLVYMIFALFLITAMVIAIAVVFQRRKNKLIEEKIKQKETFSKEMQTIQAEVQEETLRFIGRELHDNVGQILAYANMQIQMLAKNTQDQFREKVSNTSETIKKGIEEVRSLSKSLNSDVILEKGLIATVANETERLRRFKFEEVVFTYNAEKDGLIQKSHQLVLFRIIQEFLSNSLKYSEAQKVEVHFDFCPNDLKIVLKDDGRGFDMETVEPGSGLINMKKRAELINTRFTIESAMGAGVKVEMVYPFQSILIKDFE